MLKCNNNINNTVLKIILNMIWYWNVYLLYYYIVLVSGLGLFRLFFKQTNLFTGCNYLIKNTVKPVILLNDYNAISLFEYIKL